MNTPLACGCGLARRRFLGGLGAAGALAALEGCGALALRTPGGLIDVHHHPSPPGYIEAGGPRNVNVVGQSWTPAKALEQMDQAGVARAISSITGPGMTFPPDEASRLARICNDYCARLMADHPGRFGMYVNLPMPHIDASLREIAYGMDVLKAEGVALVTNYGDKWLGDPAFDPVFAELNRRKAIVFTHPASAKCCTNLVPGIGDAAIEYGADTTRAIARFLFSGSAQRYPDLRIIWSHGGGTMPFLVDRFINMGKSRQYAARFPQGVLPILQRFHYDTAQVPNRPALLALKATVPVSQILFGTDYPFLTSEHHVRGIGEAAVFNGDEWQAVAAGNWERLARRA